MHGRPFYLLWLCFTKHQKRDISTLSGGGHHVSSTNIYGDGISMVDSPELVCCKVLVCQGLDMLNIEWQFDKFVLLIF